MPDSTTLQIEIRDNSEQAARGLKALASSLETIKKAASGGMGNLAGVAEQVKKLSEALTAAIPEENIQRIERLTAAIGTLNSAGEISLKMNGDFTAQLEKSVADMEKLKEAASLQPKDSGQKYVQGHIEIDRAGESAQAAAPKFERFISALRSGHSALNDFSSSVGGLAKNLLGLGKNVASGAVRGIRSLISGMGDLQKRLSLSNTGLGKMFAAVKRIAMYRLIRSAIKMITDGLKTGVDNLYNYSKAIGGEFARSMDIGSGASLKFKNSIAAMLGPAIQAAIALLSTLASVAIQAANAINQVFAVLSGSSVWTHAADGMNSVEKAAKGAGGATKDLLADFDELNIIQSQGGGGGGGSLTDGNGMFVTEALEENGWTLFATRVKEAIEKGDWRSAGNVVAQKLRDLIDRMPAQEWAQRLNGWIKNALSFAVGLMEDESVFSAFGTKIGQFLFGIFGADNRMNWELLGAFLRMRITAAISTLYGLFTTPDLFEGIGESFATLVQSFLQIDVGLIARTIAAGINGAITAAKYFIKNAPFHGIGQKINGFLTTLFSTDDGGINWASAGETLRKAIVGVFDAAGEAIGGGNDGGGIFTKLGSSVAMFVNNLFTFDKDEKDAIVKALNDSIKDAIDGVDRFFEDTNWAKIGEDIEYWIESLDWNGIATRVWDVIEEAFTAAGKIGEHILLGIYNAIVGFIQQSDLLGKIFGHPEKLADTETLYQWLETGTYEGMRRDANGKLTIRPADLVSDVADALDVAKKNGVEVSDIMNDLASGARDYAEFAQEATDALSDPAFNNALKNMQPVPRSSPVFDFTSSTNGTEVLEYDLGEPAVTLDTNEAGDIFDQIYQAINDYDPSMSGTSARGFWANVLDPLVGEALREGGVDASKLREVADAFKQKWLQSLTDEDWEGSTGGLINILQELIDEARTASVPEIEHSGFNASMQDMAASAESAAARIRAALASIGGFGFSMPRLSLPMVRMAASGAIMTTGQMFIARESGPEYVGTMGGHTAVANNEQIISGVASGVAAGQAEQNALLRQQNALLSQMLNKKLEVVPSANLGRAMTQSTRMYERISG